MKMKNVVLLGAVILLLLSAYQPAQAGVAVGVNVGLPVVTFPAPPQLAVIPGTYAYFASDVDADIVFYGGRWHRYWNGRWYLGRGYNGPWVFAGPRFVVPGPLLYVRPGWRNTIVIHDRIRYDDFNRHWRTWERDRYWEHKHDWWRKARDEHRRDYDGKDRDGKGIRDGRDRDGKGVRDGKDRDGKGVRDGKDRDGKGVRDGKVRDGKGVRDGKDRDGKGVRDGKDRDGKGGGQNKHGGDKGDKNRN